MNRELIDELEQCAATCNECYNGCLAEPDVEKLQRCMSLDQECYDVCELTARMLEQGSDRTKDYLRLCSEVCRACKEECEKHTHDHCRKCAEQCQKCAEMCHSFAA